MAQFCVSFNQTPETFYKLTISEIAAFYDVVTPKTDLTGLI